ncbi:MAG: enoyl-CoA hydratase/isomerase family protein, partial [Dehalococcoidales bacterium]|nr:enoyl-CoA hydratase/isomerase family protein [Dehalococcoidales bacterium]
MRGPSQLIRSGKLAECKVLACIYEWSDKAAYLTIDRVSFPGKTGAILCYCNPPVHQVGNRDLDAYLQGLGAIIDNPPGIDFLILCGANDPVHAGGDLRETLANLDRTAMLKKEKQQQGASPEEIDRLYDWADSRIRKGGAVHSSVRKVAGFARTVAVCGGGARFGGSAEIPLTADFLVADSRSGLCFSEAMLGIIPGWSGVARTLVKAGLRNAAYMAELGREVKAGKLKEIGVANEVVSVPLPFPRKQKTDQPEVDNAEYQKALDAHDEETGLLLLPKALELATCPEDKVSKVTEKDRRNLDEGEDVSAEIARRANPENYAHLWGRPLREVQEEIGKL